MNYLAWLVVSAISFAVGEYASKRYVTSAAPGWMVATYVAYNVGVAAWFPALQQRSHLAIVGTLWSLLSLVATVAIGVGLFQERLDVWQWSGVVLALLAVAILSY